MGTGRWQGSSPGSCGGRSPGGFKWRPGPGGALDAGRGFVWEQRGGGRLGGLGQDEGHRGHRFCGLEDGGSGAQRPSGLNPVDWGLGCWSRAHSPWATGQKYQFSPDQPAGGAAELPGSKAKAVINGHLSSNNLFFPRLDRPVLPREGLILAQAPRQQVSRPTSTPNKWLPRKAGPWKGWAGWP